MRVWGSLVACCVAVAGLAPGSVSPAQAETLPELLPPYLASADAVKVAQAELRATRERLKVAIGEYYPELSAVAWAGHESFNKPNETDTHLAAKELDLTLSQLLYDFGRTDARIDARRLEVQWAEATLEHTQQFSVVEAVKAYVAVYRTAEYLTYARRSEDNVRKQTGVEQSRVDRGAGYSTDVLQAKVQLLTAEDRRIGAELDFAKAINRFRQVFNRDPGNLSTMRLPAIPRSDLPGSIEEAIRIAEEENPSLKIATLKTAVAQETVKEEFAGGFFPRVELIADHRRRQNAAGTPGLKQETTLKGQVSLPFNLGLTAINTLKAAEHGVTAEEHRYTDQRDTIEEEIRNNWEEYASLVAQAELKRNQANLAEQFLTLARKERNLGTRSLIDVLTGETTQINAQADALVAEADVVTTAFNLLYLVGRLEPEMAMIIAGDRPPVPATTPAAKKTP